MRKFIVANISSYIGQYSEEEIQELIFTHKIGNRELAVFDIDFCYCCKRPYLMWNVVL